MPVWPHPKRNEVIMPMASAARGAARLRYTEDFLTALSAYALFGAAVTGIVVYTAAPGTDLAVAQQPYWGVAKWFILDVHVVLSFCAVIGVPLVLLLKVLRRARPAQPRRWKRVAAAALGLLAGYLITNYTLEEHPILVETIRATDYPSSRAPDQITLTWAGDPQTTQAVQWRSGEAAQVGRLRYRPMDTADWQTADAATEPWQAHNLANDISVLRHTVLLTGLAPGTTYEYQVAHDPGWTGARTFRTAPAQPEPFSFIYLGDSQQGLLEFGALLENVAAAEPDAAFYIHAGDLVNRGCDRDDWDVFFHATRNVFDRYAVMPAIGNHDDCDPLDPRLYRAFLALPENGSDALPPEHSYHFTYGGAFFAVLNSNKEIAEQAPWLEAVLAASDARWKFLMWHHPAYASKEHRDNAEVRRHWVPLADKYDVDMVFQGHDHAYLRTKPMRDNAIVDSYEEGIPYIVSTSGTKFYEQMDRDYIEVGFEEVPTYQVIRIDGGTLTYEARDTAGQVVDAFTLTE